MKALKSAERAHSAVWILLILRHFVCANAVEVLRKTILTVFLGLPWLVCSLVLDENADLNPRLIPHLQLYWWSWACIQFLLFLWKHMRYATQNWNSCGQFIWLWNLVSWQQWYAFVLHQVSTHHRHMFTAFPFWNWKLNLVMVLQWNLLQVVSV